jgi:hypothetical protein
VNCPSNTYTPCEEQQLGALRMLAGRPDGATALSLLLHAFEKRCMTKLVACGYCDRETRAGLHGGRYRITQAGHDAALPPPRKLPRTTPSIHASSGA